MGGPFGPTATANVANVSHLPQILAVESAVCFLAVLFVSLRLYVRIKVTNGMGRDDWTISIAAICSIAAWALFVYQGMYGLGRHIEYISLEGQTKIAEAEFWQVIISSCVAMCLLKVSIALSLLRLSPSTWYKWCLWFGIAFVSAYSFMACMTFFCYCTPMKAFWDHSIKNAKCYSLHLFITFAIINTAFNIFTNVLFATLPIPIIWKLQMKRRVRLYLIGVLSLGYIAVIFGIINAVYQLGFASETADPYFNDWIMFYAVLQVNTGIVAACAPSLKPLVSKALKLSDYATSRTRGNTYGKHYGSRYASQSRSMHWHNQYALEELQSHDEGKRSDEVQFKDKAGNYSATVTFYKGNGAAAEEYGSRSDEMILSDRSPQQEGNGKGDIVMTTEVIVQ